MAFSLGTIVLASGNRVERTGVFVIWGFATPLPRGFGVVAWLPCILTTHVRVAAGGVNTHNTGAYTHMRPHTYVHNTISLTPPPDPQKGFASPAGSHFLGETDGISTACRHRGREETPPPARPFLTSLSKSLTDPAAAKIGVLPVAQ